MTRQKSKPRRFFTAAVLLLIGAAGAFWLWSNLFAGAPGVPDADARRDDRGVATDAVAAAEAAMTRDAVQAGGLTDGGPCPVYGRGDATHAVLLVVDRGTRAPVAGARVELFERPLLRDVWQPETLFSRAPVLAAVSEQDGTVWVPRVLRGVFHVDVAGPEYHATQFVRIELTDSEAEPLVVEAALGGRVHGRVVTRSLEPVTLARVLAVPPAAVMIDAMQGGHLTLRTARVGRDGTYELAGLPAASGWRIATFDGAFAPSTSAEFAVVPGELAEVDVVVAASRALVGQVRSATGAPVADALVTYTTPAPSGLDGYDLLAHLTAPQHQTSTDSAGRFALPGVPAAKVRIWAVHQDRASAPQIVDLRPARLPPVELVLDHGPALMGRVVDPKHAGIADAEITFLGPNGSKLSAEERATARSAVDGSFTLPCPAAESAKVANVLVRRRGYARAIEELTVPADHPVEFVLQPGRAIRGTVTAAATGAPVPQFSLHVDAPKPVRDLGRAARDDIVLEFHSADGTFRTASEFGGVVELVVEAGGFDSKKVEADLEANADAPLRFELEPALLLAGEVVDAAGVPVEGAVVEAGDWAMTGIYRLDFGTGSAHAAATDAAGRFEVRGVRPSTDKYVQVNHPDYLPLQNQRVQPSGGKYAPQRFTLLRGGGIAGVVTGDGGYPCSGFEVVCISTSGQGALRRATTDAGGNYRIDRLDPALAYDLAVLLPGTPLDMSKLLAAMQQSGVRVTAGAVARVDLTYKGAGNGAIHGRVAYADGTALAGGTVLLLDDGPAGAFGLRGSRRGSTAGDGRFEITGVAAGDYVVVFGDVQTSDRNSARSGRRALTIAPGQDVELDLIVEAGEMRGTVRTAETGAPVSGAHVLLQPANAGIGTPQNAILLRLGSRSTDESGRFAFRAVAPGTYFLLAMPPSGARLAAVRAGPFTVSAANQPVEAAIDLPGGALLLASVRDGSGGVAGARLLLQDATGALAGPGFVTGADGTLAAAAPPPGQYSMRARAGDRESEVQQVTVPGSGVVQVEFALRR